MVHHQQQQQQQRQQQLSNDLVWSILLESQQQLDQRVICKLLSCSQSMARLVHVQCRGQLHAQISAAKTADMHDTYGTEFCSWLSHNAMLLHSLTVLGPKGFEHPAVSEADLASGLTAAAADIAAEVTEEQVAAAAAAATAAAAVAAAPTSASAHGPATVTCSTAGLPLQSLACELPCQGALLGSLAATSQLTALCFVLAHQGPFGPASEPAFGHALAELKTLRRLALMADGPLFSVSRLSGALQNLTRLTCLDLDPTSRLGQQLWLNVHPTDIKSFPPSLIKLQLVSCGPNHEWDFQHLTLLTILQFRAFEGRACFPPSLQALRLPDCHRIPWLDPGELHGLREVQITGLGLSACNMNAVRRFSRDVEWLPNLKAVHIDMWSYYSLPGVVECVEALGGVPLVSLELQVTHGVMGKDVIERVGALTKLTKLSLGVGPADLPALTVNQLASVVRQLPSLAHFAIRGMCGYTVVQSSGSPDWVQFCQALSGVSTLRCVSITTDACMPCDAIAHLAAATQLKRLELVECGVEWHS